MDVVEKARRVDRLEEVDQKDGLFVIEDMGSDFETYYLDLPDGYNLFGYDEMDNTLEVRRRDVPQDVLDLKSYVRAKGSAQLSNYEG